MHNNSPRLQWGSQLRSTLYRSFIMTLYLSHDIILMPDTVSPSFLFSLLVLFEENCDLRVFPLVPDLTTILLRALKWPPNELKSLQMLLQ